MVIYILYYFRLLYSVARLLGFVNTISDTFVYGNTIIFSPWNPFTSSIKHFFVLAFLWTIAFLKEGFMGEFHLYFAGNCVLSSVSLFQCKFIE